MECWNDGMVGKDRGQTTEDRKTQGSEGRGQQKQQGALRLRSLREPQGLRQGLRQGA